MTFYTIKPIAKKQKGSGRLDDRTGQDRRGELARHTVLAQTSRSRIEPISKLGVCRMLSEHNPNSLDKKVSELRILAPLR